jgi:non-specific serine/threonine protein kinase
MAENAGSFGELLKRYRGRAGLTQEELAEAAGLSVRGLSDLERGVVSAPRAGTLRLLARALQLAPEDEALWEAARKRGAGAGEGLGLEARTSDHRPDAGQEAGARDNLPVPLTSFVGRRQDMAEVEQLLGRTRLLTLTGPGGVGKTRLAVQVAADCLEEYAQGVWLVQLAPLADPALVPAAVAGVLGVIAEAHRPLVATLNAVLRPKRLLLVLDNCEHLIGACAAVAEALLQACPQLRILATSREALGIGGEIAWPVPSLEVPGAGQPLEAIGQCAAVRLFIDRARAVQPHFLLTEQNAGAVAQVCRRLDGIPLALELAAACLRGLSVAEVSARLDGRFELLTGGSRTALPRHQTLRATVEWSYGLLSPAEQTLFQRLAVFTGGWTLEAAVAVCAGGALGSAAVLGLLLRLVNTSLVLAEEGSAGETRYRLLETLRQYAHERLAEQAERGLSQEQHADYYLALAQAGAAGLHGAGQLLWFERFEADHANLLAAARWLMTTGQGSKALQLVTALYLFWEARGHRGLGRQLLASALATPGVPTRSAVHVTALAQAGAFALFDFELAQARVLFGEALTLARELDDPWSLAFAQFMLARLALEQGEAAAARPLLEDSVALFRRTDDRWRMAWALELLAEAVGGFDLGRERGTDEDVAAAGPCWRRA